MANVDAIVEHTMGTGRRHNPLLAGGLAESALVDDIVRHFVKGAQGGVLSGVVARIPCRVKDPILVQNNFNAAPPEASQKEMNLRFAADQVNDARPPAV